VDGSPGPMYLDIGVPRVGGGPSGRVRTLLRTSCRAGKLARVGSARVPTEGVGGRRRRPRKRRTLARALDPATVAVEAGDGIRFLLVAGTRSASRGLARPIVMNTEDELRQAFRELDEGTFSRRGERLRPKPGARTGREASAVAFPSAELSCPSRRRHVRTAGPAMWTASRRTWHWCCRPRSSSPCGSPCSRHLMGRRFFTRPRVGLGCSARSSCSRASASATRRSGIVGKPDNRGRGPGARTGSSTGTAASGRQNDRGGSEASRSTCRRGARTLPHLAAPRLLELVSMVLVTLLLSSGPSPAGRWRSGEPHPHPNRRSALVLLGLQELLVYFDPWLAGGVPGLISWPMPSRTSTDPAATAITFDERPLAHVSSSSGSSSSGRADRLRTFLRGPN